MVQMIGTLLITSLARRMIDLQVDTGVFNELVATFSAQRFDIKETLKTPQTHAWCAIIDSNKMKSSLLLFYITIQ